MVFSGTWVALLLAASTTITSVSACKGQSCKIADASGSTGAPRAAYMMSRGHLKSEKASGDRCIDSWWNSNFNIYSKRKRSLSSAKFRLNDTEVSESFEDEDIENIPEVRDSTGLDIADIQKRNSEIGPLYSFSCKPFILLYTRGTTEVGDMGELVGPNLARHIHSAMPGKFEVKGVPSRSNFAGDYCAGIPAGKVMARMLNAANKACPNANIALAGYSMGAMAVHMAAAFGNQQARSKVFAAVAFGDPFFGAKIKNFDMSKLKTFCHVGDGVCGGALRITPTHLTYGKDAKAGADFIAEKAKSIEGGGGGGGGRRPSAGSDDGDSGSGKGGLLGGIPGLGGKGGKGGLPGLGSLGGLLGGGKARE